MNLSDRTSFVGELVRYVRSEFATDEFIPLHAPVFGDLEKELVLETLESGFVSSVGHHVGDFEKAVAEYTGASHAIATVNGTAALHACLVLAGVGRDEEVITQSLTFVATCNAISYCFARPVFVDVERATLGMCPESLENWLVEHAEVRDDGLCWNKRSNRVVRACVPMHTFGHPVRIDRIAEICSRWNLVLVEDAAESLGSFFVGKHTGNWGKLAALSFNGNKIITTGGGGMILTDDEDLAQRAKHITTTAKQAHPWLYIHDEVGFNYRLPAINAALGCAQMTRLPDYVDRKRALAKRYADWFSNLGIEFVDEPERAKSNFWFNAFLATDRRERDDILAKTNQAGVMTRPCWTPMHRLDLFSRFERGPLAVSEMLDDRLVCIPSSVI